MALYVDIKKSLGDFHLEVKFEAGDEIFSLLGASGCGKSLTLKCIAGIERPDSGRIVLDGVTLFDSERGINLKPQQRRAGYLFQQYALFPNMTVRQNIRCGVRRETAAGSGNNGSAALQDADVRVEEMLEAMQLESVAELQPSQLSGGQQQRTALGRILINDPNIVMLDEPFSALDTHLRFWMENSVKKMMRRYGKTVLLISHDRDEVFRMADSIAVMDQGRLQVSGPKHEVFRAPCTVAAARLTGCKNIAPAKVVDSHHLNVAEWGMTLETVQDCTGAGYAGVRLHDVHLLDAEEPYGRKDRVEEGRSGADSDPGYEKNANMVSCIAAETIENPFSYTVILKTAEGTGTFGMEIGKDRWNEVKKSGSKEVRLAVHIPPDAVLPLCE